MRGFLATYEKEGAISEKAADAALEFAGDVGAGLPVSSMDAEEALALGFAFGHDAGAAELSAAPSRSQVQNYVVNTNTDKFHDPNCYSVDDIKPQNRFDYVGDRQILIDLGFKPCGNCKP